jgi:hypothetical protein
MPGGSFSSRVLACWRLKAALAAIVSFTFCVPYFLIGNFPLLPVRELPLTALDQAIGFHPYPWVWIYQSEYIILNAIPWLARGREELIRYVRGFAMLSLISFLVFLVFPIRAPKPAAVVNATGMYWLLQQYDVPYNSLPSLHASLVVYTLAFGNRVVGREVGRGVKLLFVVWGALILYATLATKEHYLADIVTGVALAVAGDRWAWRGIDRRRGLLEDAQQQRADVPLGGEVMIGVADGVELTREIDDVVQQDAAAVVRTK